MPPLAVHGPFELKTYAMRRSDGRYDAYYAIRPLGAPSWVTQGSVRYKEGFSSQREALMAADWEARARIDERPC
jgi:hypothetical protein